MFFFFSGPIHSWPSLSWERYLTSESRFRIPNLHNFLMFYQLRSWKHFNQTTLVSEKIFMATSVAALSFVLGSLAQVRRWSLLGEVSHLGQLWWLCLVLGPSALCCEVKDLLLHVLLQSRCSSYTRHSTCWAESQLTYSPMCLWVECKNAVFPLSSWQSVRGWLIKQKIQ